MHKMTPVKVREMITELIRYSKDPEWESTLYGIGNECGKTFVLYMTQAYNTTVGTILEMRCWVGLPPPRLRETYSFVWGEDEGHTRCVRPSHGAIGATAPTVMLAANAETTSVPITTVGTQKPSLNNPYEWLHALLTAHQQKEDGSWHLRPGPSFFGQNNSLGAEWNRALTSRVEQGAPYTREQIHIIESYMSPELHPHRHTVKTAIMEHQATTNSYHTTQVPKAPPQSLQAKEAHWMNQPGYGHICQQHNQRELTSHTSGSSKEKHDSHTHHVWTRHMHIHRQSRGRTLRYPRRRHRRQRRSLRIFSAQLCAQHHNGYHCIGTRKKLSNGGYFVTDPRIGEASNPGPLPRNQRRYIASTRAGDNKHQTIGGDNLADLDGHLKVSTYNGNCFNTPPNG